MPVTTEQQIAEWDALSSAATPGPWELRHDWRNEDGTNTVPVSGPKHGHFAEVVWRMDDDERSPTCEATAKLIVVARAAIPALIADLREARAQLAESEQDNARLRSEWSAPSEVAEANQVKAFIIEERQAWMHAVYNLLDAIGCPLPPGAAAADVVARGAAEVAEMRRDAARYQGLRRGQRWSVINGIGDALRAEELDAAMDHAITTQEKP